MLWATVQDLIKPIHLRLRTEKIRLFSRAFCPSSEDTLLDIGGGFGIAGEFRELYSHFSRVVVLNLEQPETDGIPSTRVERINADGCLLPFKDRSFDWIFSNAVIEHVGRFARQEKFANEIRRVYTKGYFVTTPNRYFPIEPHALLPFYQHLSPSWQRRVVRFSPGYLRKWEEINLLSPNQMRKLFPEAKVIATGFPLIGNSLVAHARMSSL